MKSAVDYQPLRLSPGDDLKLALEAHFNAAALLDRPPLGAQCDRGPDGAFRRRSCCLIYRAAPGRRGALCGDCALRAAEDRP